MLIRGGHDDRSRWLRGPKHDDPLRVLDERLARSQIDLADYLGRCALLSKPRSLVTGHVWTSKEDLEIAYNRYEVTWWKDSPPVQAMRADAETYPGLLERHTAAANAGGDNSRCLSR